MGRTYVDDHRILLEGKDITDFCSGVSLKDSIDSLAVELSFSVFRNPHDKYVPVSDVSPGRKVKVVNHDTVVFFGKIVTCSLDGTVTAYDNGWYLNKSQVLFQCVKLKADDAIRQLGIKGGVTVGEIAPLSTLISGTWTAETPADILKDILDACTRETGRQYRFRVNPENGKLDIRELTGEATGAFHKPAENLAAFNITWALGQVSGTDSSDNLANAVAVVAEVDEKVFIGAYAANPQSIEKFGYLQKVETVNEYLDNARLEQQVKNILAASDRLSSQRTISEIQGADEVTSGVVLRFNSPAFGIIGLYRVTEVTHFYQAAGHSMSLELESLEQPRAITGSADTVSVNGLPEDLGMTEKEKKKGVSKTTSKKAVNAIFTAYYPANNAQEGGYKDCMGNWLDPSKKTVAVPEEVPMLSRITIFDTNTELDGQTYTATDHGDAIVIDSDGTYHIDILMSSLAECNAWGVKSGKAVIDDGTEDEEEETAETIKDEIKAFLKAARGELGYHEQAGGYTKFGDWYGKRNGGSYAYAAWCVMFVSWCANQSGAPIPEYALVSRMRNYFEKRGLFKYRSSGYIPKPGDLMIQADQHIGIVESATKANIKTIEGNHSNSVCRVTRSYGEITGFCTPWG